MTVYELIAELMKRPGNEEVFVCLPGTAWVEVKKLELDLVPGEIGIVGGNADVFDAEGEVVGNTDTIGEQLVSVCLKLAESRQPGTDQPAEAA